MPYLLTSVPHHSAHSSQQGAGAWEAEQGEQGGAQVPFMHHQVKALLYTQHTVTARGMLLGQAQDHRPSIATQQHMGAGAGRRGSAVGEEGQDSREEPGGHSVHINPQPSLAVPASLL